MLGMQIKLLRQAECITVQRNCYHILIIIPITPILAINFKELLQRIKMKENEGNLRKFFILFRYSVHDFSFS